MSLNRLTLSGEEQNLKISFGNVDIVGTGAKEGIVLEKGLNNVHFNVGEDDIVVFGDLAENYEITSLGGNVIQVKDNNDNIAEIGAGGTGFLGFNNGKAPFEMDLETGTPQLDGNNITTTPLNMGAFNLQELPPDLVDMVEPIEDQYTVSLSVNDSDYGTVTGEGTFNEGEEITVSATSKDNFSFVKWVDNGTEVSTNENYVFTVTENITLTAIFDKVKAPTNLEPSDGATGIDDEATLEASDFETVEGTSDYFEEAHWQVIRVSDDDVVYDSKA